MLTRRSLFAVPAVAAVGGRRKIRDMATYAPCAGSPISLLASADTTGVNKGNLTNAFTTNVLGTMPAIWEWYHAVVDTLVPGVLFTPAPCTIKLNLRKTVTFTYPVGGTEYDPSQPIQFRNGDELFFFWNLVSSSTPVPQVTLYLRYDTELPANRGYRG